MKQAVAPQVPRESDQNDLYYDPDSQYWNDWYYGAREPVGDEYDERNYWNSDEYSFYDECDWDSNSNKMRISTYSTQKKPKTIKSTKRTKSMNPPNSGNPSRKKRKITRPLRPKAKLYGVIVINGRSLFIGTIYGNHCTEIYSKSNGYSAGKHSKGGQSAPRFGRIYDNKMECFIKESAMECNREFDQYRQHNLVGIILGGNGRRKEQLLQSKHLSEGIVKSKIIQTINTQNGGKAGFEEIKMRISEIAN